MTQKLADEEFKELVTARNQHRKIFMNIEALQSTPISEKLSLPVNVTRIVSDAVHNLNLKAGDPGFKTFDPVAAMEAIKQCFEELDRKLVNPSISHIPPHFRGRNELLKMSIRTHLCLRELIKHGINNAALEIIIKNIVTTYARALITYGKSVGILAAQAVSEPTTQLVISSHHTIGISSTKKKGMFRIREIFGAKPTENMLGPSMVFRVIPEFRSDKSKVKEIASAIELLTLKDFVANISVFYEDYGKPTHPEFIHEKDIIREYEKYNKHIRPPTDLTNWCIRIEVDKFKLVLKNMTIETIYTRLTDSAGNLFIVYNSDNSEKVIMRIYVRNIQTQKSESVTSAESANKLIRKLLNMPMRGIEGITAANVQEQSISTIQEDGSIKMETIFNIITEGSNLRAILENPYVDTRTVISDSIKEMEEIFGIVCARNRIIAELRYQVSVPTYRHLTVFADEMTQTGVFTSIDRYGSAKRHSNFMQKISDASPVAIIEDAALSRATTRIEGVSTPIMIGKNPEIGDLYNTFTIDVDYISQQKKQLDDIFKSF